MQSYEAPGLPLSRSAPSPQRYLPGLLIVVAAAGCGSSRQRAASADPIPVVPIAQQGSAAPGYDQPPEASTATKPQPTALTASATAAPDRFADVSAADRATARALASNGHTKLQAGDAKGALKDFTAADAIIQVPTIRLEMARAQLQLGQTPAACTTLHRIIRMPSNPHDPAVFKRAHAEASSLAQQQCP